jgi:hypothetical protein
MKLPALFFALGLALLSGCASGPRTTALQTRLTTISAAHPRPAKEVKVAVIDKRTDRTLDVIMAKEAAVEVADAIRAGLRDSKLFNLGDATAATWEINGALVRLDWFVPAYQAMLKKVFATSLLTGGIGGVAYGSTSTPVLGHATVKITVLRSGSELFSREYAGLHEESLAKLRCDTLETKSRVAGLAVADAVDKFLKDVDLLGTADTDAAGRVASDQAVAAGATP